MLPPGSVRRQWVTSEFAAAANDRAPYLALHHLIYSFDAAHSRSSRMADALGNAIRDTGRVPNLVQAGHVHIHQRMEKTIAPETKTPFVVTGNGGCHNLHAITGANGTTARDTGAALVYGVENWGYLSLTIDAASIRGQATEIDRNGLAGAGDVFTFSAASVTLSNPTSVPTL